MTIKNLITYFRQFTEQHPILQTFSWGNLSDYSREDYITKYPAIHFVPQPSTLNDTSQDITFSVLIYDLLNEYVDNPENSNQLDSMALCEDIMGDFTNYFINQLTQYGYYLQTPVNYNYFTDRFAESVCGVEAGITITIEQTACIPPYEPPVELPAQNNLQFWYDATDTDTMSLYQDSSGTTRVHQMLNKGVYTGGTLTAPTYETYDEQGIELSFDLQTNTPCLTIDYTDKQTSTANERSRLLPPNTETGFTSTSGYTWIIFNKYVKDFEEPLVFTYSHPQYYTRQDTLYGSNFTTSKQSNIVVQGNTQSVQLDDDVRGSVSIYNQGQSLKEISYYSDYGLNIAYYDILNNNYGSWLNEVPGDYANTKYSLTGISQSQISGLSLGGRYLFGSAISTLDWQGGNFYEVCVWDRVLTNDEISQVRNYFNKKYNNYTKYVDYQNYNRSILNLTTLNNPTITTEDLLQYNQYSEFAGLIEANWDDNNGEQYPYIYNYAAVLSSNENGLHKYGWNNTYPIYTPKLPNYNKYVAWQMVGFDDEGLRPLATIRDLSNDNTTTYRCDGRIMYEAIDVNKSYNLTLNNTTTDCGFSSGDTYNIYFEIPSTIDGFLLREYDYDKLPTTLVSSSTGFTGSFVIRDGYRIEANFNKNNVYTGNYQLWETDGSGNELNLLSELPIPTGSFNSVFDSWFADGHRKLKIVLN